MRHFCVLLLSSLMVYIAGCLPPTRSPLWEAAEQRDPVRPRPLSAASEKSVVESETPTDASLATILRLVATQNPAVEAARRRWLAATHKRPQVVALPDPKLEYRAFVRPMARADEQWELELSQEIPYPGKLSMHGKIADKEAEVAYVRYQIALRNALAEAKEVYSELYYIERAQQITADIETLYTRYAALAVGGTEVARPKLPERFRAESQRAQLGYDVLLLREMRQAEIARLHAVTGIVQRWEIPPLPNLPEPLALPQSFEDLQVQAAQFNQELAMAGIEVERAQYQTQLARYAPIPDIMLRTSYTRTGAERDLPDPTRDPISVGVAVSLPVWVSKYQAILHEAREAARAAQAEQGAQQLQIRADLARAYFSLHNAARLVRLYRDTLLPQAQQALNAAEELYRKGEANLASILETTATVHNFTLARTRATADFYQNVARIERLIGTALPLQRAPEEEQRNP